MSPEFNRSVLNAFQCSVTIYCCGGGIMKGSRELSSDKPQLDCCAVCMELFRHHSSKPQNPQMHDPSRFSLHN